MKERGLNNACPQCQGQMSEADEMFYKQGRLCIHAKRNGDYNTAELFQSAFKK
jgi:hypothetical protein